MADPTQDHGRAQSAIVELRDGATADHVYAPLVDSARARELVARVRDAAARERDDVAALRDAELLAGEVALQDDLRVFADMAAMTGGRVSAGRVAAARFLAADARVRAARDREHAARDREQAARDRLQAREEREALLAQLARPRGAATDDDDG
jgi:hypothetical protein